ncbi:apolipoprotein N-acyltransferase [Nocardia sp. NPDC051570]|uniref:apolipoprotein N-acyltransferase n=1 Tax=Nocardia sp. NPDC051570 TaxID=3364324 RepID=UPI00378AC8F9
MSDPRVDSAERREDSSVPGPVGRGSRVVGRAVALWDRFPVIGRSAAAIVAGLLIFASFPPRTCWYLAPLGIALLTLVVRGNGRLRGGFGYGMLAGLGFFVPLLPWTGIYVGPVPWLGLSTVCAVYVGLFGLLARLVSALPGWPLWVATMWTLTEWIRSSFPFGGFPWGRLAFGQADGWYLPLAMIAGAPGVSFAVAVTGTLLAALLIRLRPRPVDLGSRQLADLGSRQLADLGSRHALRRDWRGITALATLVAIILGTGAILRAALPAPDDGDRLITVAAVQGSVPRLGLDFNSQRRAVLDNHVRRTEELARAIDAGRAPRPDVVIWPENSSDIDPLRNSDAAAEITAASQLIHAPILVGAVLVNADDTTTNSVLVWDGDRVGERHDKKIIQPFGEYLPFRGFFRHFSQYADRAGYFVPGHGDGVVHVRPARGGAPVAIGVATCYEVAFDRAFEDSLRAGAQLLTVPTNNATFGRSEMTYQQLAMSRVRAVEHGRALVVSATTGVSAIITADGAVAQQTPQFVPAVLEASLPLRHTTTLSTRFGPLPERILCIVAAIVVVIAAIRRRTSRPTHLVNEGAIGGRVSGWPHAKTPR